MSGPMPPSFEDYHWRRYRRRRARGASGVVLGATIIAIGVLLLLDNLGIMPPVNLGDYWPVILIAFGLARLTNTSSPSSLIWGGAITAAGALLLLNNLKLIYFPVHLFWPVLVIAFGASMLFRAAEAHRYVGTAPGGVACNGPSCNSWSVFGGVERRIETDDFQSAYISAIFGGVKLDLRRAQIKQGRAIIDVNAVFGGVEMMVPENWSVVVEATGVFGGIEDKTRPPQQTPGQPNPVLVVTGAAAFGGVSIAN
jgi:predicted membrane protein